MSQAIYPFGKAIGLTYCEPKVPLRILFVAESPPANGFFYDQKHNTFRNRLFFLINQADLHPKPLTTIKQFNERGYFLADAINCRWDKSGPAGKLTTIRNNCSEHLKNLIIAMKPQAIVLMGRHARLSFRNLNYKPVSTKLVIEIPFILTAPVRTEVLVDELKRLKPVLRSLSP